MAIAWDAAIVENLPGEPPRDGFVARLLPQSGSVVVEDFGQE
ncbi:hypothetical protein [Streptomyces sp. NPDC046631]